MSADIRTLTNAILSTSNTLVREAGRLFRPHGLTTVQFNVLNLLINARDGLRPSELTAALVVDASSTTYVLDRMETLGWLKRIDDDDDRRACRIVLTSTGRKMHATVLPLYNAALAGLVENLSRSKIPAFIAALAEIQQTAPRAVDAVLASPTARTSRDRKTTP